MEKYNYIESIKDDIRDFLKDYKTTDYEDRDEMYEALYDELWITDSVTGNASGSYWCNAWKAEEAICHNLDLLADALDEFGGNGAEMIKSAETADCVIRCYLLGQALSEVLDEMLNA